MVVADKTKISKIAKFLTNLAKTRLNIDFVRFTPSTLIKEGVYLESENPNIISFTLSESAKEMIESYMHSDFGMSVVWNNDSSMLFFETLYEEEEN